MLDEMCSLMRGRAAEELFTGHISSGAMNDLERATKSAYGMVAYLGRAQTTALTTGTNMHSSLRTLSLQPAR